MCIKILQCNASLPYDATKPLDEQLKNAKEVVIDYDPKDQDLEHFLQEMERLVKTGVSVNCDVSVDYNSSIRGMRAKKQVKRIKKDLDLNEAIKILVNIHSELDKQLEAISVFCRKR
jgi:cell fate (sporulation/competence/biofilm development) regulator YlbF (YheA/YmcA/DUF963 family)